MMDLTNYELLLLEKAVARLPEPGARELYFRVSGELDDRRRSARTVWRH